MAACPPVGRLPWPLTCPECQAARRPGVPLRACGSARARAHARAGTLQGWPPGRLPRSDGVFGDHLPGRLPSRGHLLRSAQYFRFSERFSPGNQSIEIISEYDRAGTGTSTSPQSFAVLVPADVFQHRRQGRRSSALDRNEEVITGPQHYAEAQRLIRGKRVPSPPEIALAQVHATLAGAAAVLDAARATAAGIPVDDEWCVMWEYDEPKKTGA